MKKAKYMELLEEFPVALRKPLLRLVDTIIEQIRTEFAVRREDFDGLRSAIAELTQAQKRTEERVEELTQAQKRTEERVEELAEAQKRTEERVEELAEVQKRFEKDFNMQIGALGSRCGLKTEESFRSAAEGILSEDFGIHVERYRAYDENGVVFGRPEEIEIDILIRDGKTTAIEIKSSMSKSDVYTFEKKVSFYENRNHVKVDRKIIITPMLDPRAERAVDALGMKVYTSCYDWGEEEVSSDPSAL
ncbi:MAG: PD-(D/E)XK nuclease family protein [Candidatus Methanospirareceae archaeon]